MLVFIAVALVPFSLSSAEPDDKARSDKPKVLLIGDSISGGYTALVTEMLKDKAVVLRNKGNAQQTGTGLEKLDEWLGDTKWNVIHFNWGLWDLCYRNKKSKDKTKRDKIDGVVTTPLELYGENLEKLVVRLKKTGAKLVWANTSYVPEGEPGRKLGDDKKYNAVAEEIMKKHGIPINDINALTSKFPADLFKAPGDVHYQDAGYQKIAKQVAEHIEAALKSTQKKNIGSHLQ